MSSSLLPGDAILFKSGETFPGSFRIEAVGNTSSQVILSSYGSGPKPVLTGFEKLGSWVNIGNGIWESACSQCGAKVGVVAVNSALQPMGRYPKRASAKSGYLTIASHSGITSITDTQTTQPANWTGGEIVIRTAQWLLDRYQIVSQSGNTINFQNTSNGIQDGFGYFIQGHPSTLLQAGTEVGEWYFNPSTKKLQMYFGSNDPSNYDVKVSVVDTVARLSNLRYITIDNLALVGAGVNVADLSYTIGMRIQNSTIQFSGGNGIFSDQPVDIAVVNSSILDSSNNGILSTSVIRCTIQGNVVRNSGIYAGAGSGGDGSYIGMFVYLKSDPTNLTNLISGNTVENAGYNGISFIGGPGTVANNFVNHVLFVKADGAGIYTYFNSSDTFGNSPKKIIGNIILDGRGAPDGTDDPAYRPAHGIYLDGYSANIEMTGNTVAHFATSGIFYNTANNTSASGNTLYDNGTQILMLSGNGIPTFPSLRGATVTGNIFVSLYGSIGSWLFQKNGSQAALVLRSELIGDFAQFGIFSGNSFASPFGESQVVDTYDLENGTRTEHAYSLNGWQTTYGKDLDSRSSPVLYSPGTIASSVIRFEYNPTPSPMTVTLDTSYVDATGAAYSGSATLAPYTSLVLMKK